MEKKKERYGDKRGTYLDSKQVKNWRKFTISSSSNELPLYVEWSEGWGREIQLQDLLGVCVNKNENKGKSTRRMSGLIGAVHSKLKW